MTDQQINAAVRKILNDDEHWMVERDYCSDLNASHYAERWLTPIQFVSYVFHLMELSHEPLLASARQRAESFLKTMGEWEEAE